MLCELKPAIVVIAYNRVRSLKRLLKSIEKANYSYNDIPLIISIDYAGENNPCCEVAQNFEWVHGEKIVYEHRENMGLRRHVLFCGDLSQKYDAVILLEDDIIVSPQFYAYAKKACEYYYDRDDVVGIGLYTHHMNGYASLPFYPIRNGYDTYYEKWVITWGECFCKKQWKCFRDWYDNRTGKLEYNTHIPYQITDWTDSSWSKYMVYYMQENNKFFVSPYEAYSSNFSDIGDHVKISDTTWQSVMQYGEREFKFANEHNAVKYNLFFENMDSERFKEALGVEGTIIIDLYGLCQDYSKGDYCLTMMQMGNKVIKTYGLQMKPIEMNIFEEIEGDDIYLYDMRGQKNEQKKKFPYYKAYKYNYSEISYRKLWQYVWRETVLRINMKIEKFGINSKRAKR